MECHRCEHDGKANDACLKCRGPADTNHKGRTFISLDAAPDRCGQTWGQIAAAAAAQDFPAMLGRAADDMGGVFDADADPDNDADADPDADPEGDTATGARAEPAADAGAADPSPLDMARAVAYAFTSLDKEEFHLVRRLMGGETMADIGRAEGVTRAAVSARVRSIARRCPAFRFLRHNPPV